MKIDGAKIWIGEDELPSKDDEERWRRLNLRARRPGREKRSPEAAKWLRKRDEEDNDVRDN